MIKNITAGPGVTVNQSYSSWPTFYNNNTNNPLIGQVKYNGSSQNFEVYDGTSWLTMVSSVPTVELNGHTQYLLKWVEEKMQAESEARELAKNSVAVQDALDAIKQAEEQLKTVVALARPE